jgi:tetratricopeptide (TPR) repeat protein
MSTVNSDLPIREHVTTGAVTKPSGVIELRDRNLPKEVSRKVLEGLELMSHGEPAAAALCFERAVQMAPEFADAHIGLGIAYAMTGKVYPALDHLEKAADIEPDNFFAHFKLGQLQFKLHVSKKGYEEMQKALNCATTVEERRLVGQLLREQKKLEEKSLARPTWDRPFSSKGLLLLGASVLFPILYMFIATLH